MPIKKTLKQACNINNMIKDRRFLIGLAVGFIAAVVLMSISPGTSTILPGQLGDTNANQEDISSLPTDKICCASSDNTCRKVLDKSGCEVGEMPVSCDSAVCK